MTVPCPVTCDILTVRATAIMVGNFLGTVSIVRVMVVLNTLRGEPF